MVFRSSQDEIVELLHRLAKRARDCCKLSPPTTGDVKKVTTRLPKLTQDDKNSSQQIANHKA
jgi:hypothetical protein